MSLPRLNTQRLGVTYAAASSADQTLLDTLRAQGTGTLPAYLIRVKPVIQVEGQNVQTGNAIGLGLTHIWQLTFAGPNPSDSYQHDFVVTVGDEMVFGINPNGITEELVKQRFTAFPQETAAENLQKIAFYYWFERDFLTELVAKVRGVKAQRLPSVGVFASPLTVRDLFGIPREAYYSSRLMDIAQSLIAAANLTEASSLKDFYAHIGLQGSYLEGAVFDELLLCPQGTSISAVQLLYDANNQGIRVYVVNADNVNSVLPRLALPQEVQDNITAAINAAKVVIVPERPPVYETWTGIGYIIQDPLTGEGAYLIRGGLHGGQNIPCDGTPQMEPVSAPMSQLDMLAIMLSILVAAYIVVSLWPAAGPALATAIFAGITVFFDTPEAMATPASVSSVYGPFPGDGLRPPGRCGDEEHEQLQQAVNQACKNSGLRSCGLGDSCSQARTLKVGWVTCYAARSIINQRCFLGGDGGHQQQQVQDIKNICNCEKVIAAVCP